MGRAHRSVGTAGQMPFFVRGCARAGWMSRATEAVRHEDVRADLCRASARPCWWFVAERPHLLGCWVDEFARIRPPGSAWVTLSAANHMGPLTHGAAVVSTVLGWLYGLPQPL